MKIKELLGNEDLYDLLYRIEERGEIAQEKCLSMPKCSQPLPTRPSIPPKGSNPSTISPTYPSPFCTIHALPYIVYFSQKSPVGLINADENP